MEHDWNEVPDLICDCLPREVERLGGYPSERSAQENHRLNVGIDHLLCTRFTGFFLTFCKSTYLIFSTNKVADLLGILDTCIFIAVNSRLEDAEPVVHELFGVFS